MDSTRREYFVIKERIRETTQWPEMSGQEKRDYLADLLSPFTANEDVLHELLAYGDMRFGVDSCA